MEVNPVLKNNSLHLDSLVLFRQGSNCSPSFYLQDYYKKYTNGYDIDVLAENIYERWQRFIDSPDNQSPDLSLAHCRDGIVYRLVNISRNREMLKNVPYIPFLTLPLCFIMCYAIIPTVSRAFESIPHSGNDGILPQRSCLNLPLKTHHACSRNAFVPCVNFWSSIRCRRSFPPRTSHGNIPPMCSLTATASTGLLSFCIRMYWNGPGRSLAPITTFCQAAHMSF